MATTVLAAVVVTACSKSTPETTPGPIPAAPEMATAPAGDLAGMLGSKFGLSGDQASGAIGSILSYAQTKLPAADYNKVAATISGAADNVKAAKDAGAVTGPIANPAGLTAALGKLGISPAIAGQVVPVVTDYVSKVGGPQVGKLLSGLF
jgi:hypothetical protein